MSIKISTDLAKRFMDELFVNGSMRKEFTECKNSDDISKFVRKKFDSYARQLEGAYYLKKFTFSLESKYYDALNELFPNMEAYQGNEYADKPEKHQARIQYLIAESEYREENDAL
jgi:hypothetical protein